MNVLLYVAKAYGITPGVIHDSSQPDIAKAYKRVVLKAHPDKGGDPRHFRKLQEAKEEWDKVRKEKADSPSGRRWSPGPDVNLLMKTGLTLAGSPDVDPSKPGYRIRGFSVLLTYHNVAGLAEWKKFLKFIRASLQAWGVMHWCATLERSDAGNLHTHLVLQFYKAIDKTTRCFAYRGTRPNASPNDYLDEGICRKKFQLSVNRSFFYVWADKEGTQRNAKGEPCVEGDHQPVWTKARSRYPVMAKWCESLWRQRKLSHDRYEEYLFLSREGVVSRKRNLDCVRENETFKEEEEERLLATQEVKSKFESFEIVLEAQAWLVAFKQKLDRYPFLVVLGPSRSRKTEWAKSLFSNPLQVDVGTLDHFPDGMRKFDRKVHDALILDDLRDFSFLVRHQEKLQGKVDRVVTFAETPSGGYSYRKWLWRVPIVVTANFTTKNQDLLLNDDFLGNTENRVIVQRQRPQGAD